MSDLAGMSWIGAGVAGGFLLDWAAVAFDWKRLKPISKPLAMLLLILWTGSQSTQWLSVPVGLLLAAQACGLLGDVMLLFPDQAFAAGLGAFLVGHIFYFGLLVSLYLDRFGLGGFQAEILLWLLLGAGVWSMCLVLFYRILKPLPALEEVSFPLWAGIQVYAWLLSAMLALAVVFAVRQVAGGLGRLALPAGALLFLFSDAMLTYNRFVKPFPRAQLWVRVTYHLAQFTLAWGFLGMIY